MASSRNIKQIVRNLSAGVLHVPLVDETEPVTDSTSEPTDYLLTPLSPSSKYTQSEVKIPNQKMISAVVYSHWDNILGPRVIHVWEFVGHQRHHSSTFSKICSQALSGEICRDVMNSFIDFKFFELPEEEVIVPAFIFTATGNSGPGVHSMSILIPKQQLTFYLKIHQQFQRCFERIVGKFRVLTNKNDFSKEFTFSCFPDLATDCISMMCSLQLNSFPINIPLTDTYLSASHRIDREFLSCCISSHLSSFGRSLVVGEMEEQVNMMLKTLALFNTSEERLCSSLVRRDDLLSYHHDLWLQGNVEKSHQTVLPVHEILYSQYPTTIIDLTNRNVKQSPPYPDHTVHSFDEQRNELVGLHYGDVEMGIPTGELFTMFDQTDTFVQGLIDELDKLSADCGVREAYISQFCRIIQKKALCLIKYLEAETNFGAQPYRNGLRKLRQDLCIVSDGDLHIVLAAAEKLKPGIYQFSLGTGDFGSKTPSDT